LIVASGKGLRPQKVVNEEQSVWIRVDAKEVKDEDENDDEDDWGWLLSDSKYPYRNAIGL
jgi:hypothetical protein